jgi:hypothetical protein
MIGLTGKSVKMAFAKYATNSWNVPASVTMGVFFSSDGGLKLQPKMVEDDAFGQSFLGQPEVGDYEPPDLVLSAQARYDDNLFIFDALAMGSPNAVTISSSVGSQVTSWKHVIDLADVIDGLGITLAQDKLYFVEELTSAKVYGFEEGDGDGGRILTSYKVLGTRPTVTSSVNINSTIGGAVFLAQTNRIFRKHATFRMNPQVGTSLVPASGVKYETLKLALARVMDKPSVSGQEVIDEPADNGFLGISVDVTYPRMNTVTANSLYIGLQASQAWKGDLTFKGANINSADQYMKLYEFPCLILTAFDAAQAGAAQVKPKATFKAYLAATTPTNMTFLRPMRLTRIMTNSLIAF